MSRETAGRPPQTLDAVLFDLDGTLLDIDGEGFLDAYVAALAAFWGAPSDAGFQQAVMAAAVPIFAPHPRQANGAVFRGHLARHLGLSEAVVAERLREFDQTRAAAIDIAHRPIPGARDCVTGCLALGLRVAVATTPIYTPDVIGLRLRWAGLADLPWQLVTHSENMHTCKPHTAYYREAAGLLGADPAACAMVGDDPLQDGPAAAAGMAVLLRRDGDPAGWAGPADVLLWVRGLRAGHGGGAAQGAALPASAPLLSGGL